MCSHINQSNRYRSFARTSSIVAMSAGAAVMLGWLAGIGLLQSLLPDFPPIDFNTGIGLLLAGLSLCLLSSARRSPAILLGNSFAAIALVLLGAASVLVHVGALNLFFPGSSLPPISAIIFMLFGIALILLGKNAAPGWVETPVFLAMLNALTLAIGCLYGKDALSHIPYYDSITLPAVLIFLLLCTGILALRPDRGAMALLTNNSAGGFTARRLLPAAILIPIVIGRLQFWGHETRWYDIGIGLISTTMASMLILALLIGWNALLLQRLDRQRIEATEALYQTLDTLESNLNALLKTNARLRAEIGMRRTAEENLFHEHQRTQVTLNSIGDGVITTDTEGKVAYLNPAAEHMSGWNNADAIGLPLSEVFRVVDPVSRQPLSASFAAALAGSEVTHLPSSSLLIRRDGKETAVDDSCAPMHDRNGKVIGAVLVFRDVSAMRAMSLKMSYMTQHDALTDLPNRFLLNDRLTQAIGLALRHKMRTSVLFLDLDRFKYVNDTMSHAVGDRLLLEIARRLKSCIHDTDTVSRYGGDEFIILQQEVNNALGAARMAGQVLKSITEPYFIDGHELHISASIGISICPEDGEDSATLVKHAEAAMYQAKSQGRNNYQFFTRHINERAVQRFALEVGLRRAIAHEESALYYQPQQRIADGRVIGVEALMRWNARGRGLVSPSLFIPIAEESGLIIQMGEWALRKACEQNRAWQDAGYAPIPVSVNVSAVQFREHNFVGMVERVLQETGLEPRYLELELTESVTMQDLDLVISLLRSLKNMGIGLSIDDFGTGYSSLSYLKRIPIDTLKIDRSFMQDIVINADDAAITRAIISMAKILKRKVIAEGVETFEQFEFLREQDCDAIQGFYFSEPLPAEDFKRRILGGAAMA